MGKIREKAFITVYLYKIRYELKTCASFVATLVCNSISCSISQIYATLGTKKQGIVNSVIDNWYVPRRTVD